MATVWLMLCLLLPCWRFFVRGGVQLLPLLTPCQRSIESLDHWEWTCHLRSFINNLLSKCITFIYNITGDSSAFCLFASVKVNTEIVFHFVLHQQQIVFLSSFTFFLYSWFCVHCSFQPLEVNVSPLTSPVAVRHPAVFAAVLMFLYLSLSLCVSQLVTSWSDVHGGRVDAEWSPSWRVSLHQPLGWTAALLDA